VWQTHRHTTTAYTALSIASRGKNRKIIISLQPIQRFWQNLARWCVLTLASRIANKILRFQKSKMAAVAILKIRKIATLQWNDQFWRNLVKWCVWASGHCQPMKFREFDKPRWQPPPSWTYGSAMAEGPRDALVSRNSATTKYRYRVALFVWSYV